jgi:hypothetical protein
MDFHIVKMYSKLTCIQTDKISQQPENCANRNDPDLVQAFLKKWWVESDIKRQAAPFRYYAYLALDLITAPSVFFQNII